MDKLKHFIINDIIKNADCKVVLAGKTIYDKALQEEDCKNQLKIDLESLSVTSLYILYSTVLNKN